MVVPLISALDRNAEEVIPFPATDDMAKISIKPQDGQVKEYTVDKVDCRDMANGRNDITFWLDDVREGSWKVIVTDQRVCVWNPYSKGLFGKPKEKPGKASGGHIGFGSVTHLSTFFDSKGNPILLVCCYRYSGIRTMFSMTTKNMDTMKSIACDLFDRIDEYITKNGRKSPTDGTATDKEQLALDKWVLFKESIWASSNSEFSVLVPCPSWDKVADSRLL